MLDSIDSQIEDDGSTPENNDHDYISDDQDPAMQDSIDSQIEDDGSTPENNDHDYISDDQDPAMQDDQMSKASQDDNYHTTIDGDDLDDTIQFGNPVTQPFLSRSVRIPTTEVDCSSFTQMFQGYLHKYPPPSQGDAYSQIQEMAQMLDMYLN